MKTTGKTSALASGKAINGRWTREEHELFLQALNEYGREWKKVAKRIKTRSSAQIRSHAQKYFQKLQKEQKAGLHGGAAALHGSHVVLDKVSSGKKKSNTRGDKTITITIHCKSCGGVSPMDAEFLQTAWQGVSPNHARNLGCSTEQRGSRSKHANMN